MTNMYYRNHAVALSNEDIYRFAPSVFALDKHDSRTERFQPIPTIKIVEQLRKEGFEVVSAAQKRTRDDSKRGFTTHLLRMRHVNDLANIGNAVNDSHGELVLKNANDGAAAYQLMSGVFRIVCTNGMIAATEKFDSVKVRHSGSFDSVASKVVEGTYKVIDETARILSARDDWRSITLNNDAQIAFAEAAHLVRFADSEGNTDTPIKPLQMLSRRRQADTNNDLWTMFNVVQENAIKGGLRAYNTNTNRRMTLREVTSLDNDVKINKGLWRLADYFASQVKSAA